MCGTEDKARQNNYFSEVETGGGLCFLLSIVSPLLLKQTNVADVGENANKSGENTSVLRRTILHALNQASCGTHQLRYMMLWGRASLNTGADAIPFEAVVRYSRRLKPLPLLKPRATPPEVQRPPLFSTRMREQLHLLSKRFCSGLTLTGIPLANSILSCSILSGACNDRSGRSNNNNDNRRNKENN